MNRAPDDSGLRRFAIPGVTRWVVVAASAWLVVVGIAWIVYAQGGPPLCPIRRVTGVPCPTCGATRAAISLATGHPLTALRLNPFMSVFMVVVPLYVLCRPTLGRSWKGLSSQTWTRIVWGALGLLALNWAYVLWLSRHDPSTTP